jgi:DNA topoisomerase-6 subunit B
MSKKSRKKLPKQARKRGPEPGKAASQATEAKPSGGQGAAARPPEPTNGRSSLRARPRPLTAEEMAAQQREISVSEFFLKNRHLLGFDSPRKALLTAIKEAVDNALDACEEAGILPDVEVELSVVALEDGTRPTPTQAERFTVRVRDNGPGIPAANIGKVFAKLLYGSKFHRLKMSRGQQGIGISAAAMYGQLTTGKPCRVISKIASESRAHLFELSIDTRRNEPVVHERQQIDWPYRHGTEVSIELVGRYARGRQSVEEYLELTAIANPHAQITYIGPDGQKRFFPRGVDRLPDPPKEIKPHPLGIELGMLIKMLQDTTCRTLASFLANDFSRVSTRLAVEICQKAGLDPESRPREITGKAVEQLYRVIQSTRFMAPPTDCLSPIGEEALKAGLVKTIPADFYVATTRPPAVYRGNPFQIEVALAYGSGDGQAVSGLSAEEAIYEEGEGRAEGEHKDEQSGPLARVLRFANRVPLIYQQSACATYKAVLATNWKNYGLPQAKGSLPQGPLTILIHMASVWVPFTSEAKEAVAEYDEIVREIKLALQECGRKLAVWIRKREHARSELQRRFTFARYIDEVAQACHRLKDGKYPAERLKQQLLKIAERITGGADTDRILQKPQPALELDDPELTGTVIRTSEGQLVGNLPELALEAAAQARNPVGTASPRRG